VKGLIIREPWIGMIMDGTKTWELRTQHTTMRFEIALTLRMICRQAALRPDLTGRISRL
jgi:hypothetical protein